MAPTLPRCDLLLAVMGAPHASDLTTTVLRLTQALLDRDATVQVWTCGYATLLTQASLGPAKPRNVLDWTREYPTTAALIEDMVAAHPGRLAWYSCRFCSQERGVTEHVAAVRVRTPFRFGEHVAAADRTLFLGVI